MATPEDQELEEQSPEEKTLQLKFKYLVNSLDVSSVLPAAYTIGLIDDRQRLKCSYCSNPYDKAEAFLEIIEKVVHANSKNFHTFIKVLRNTSHESIAQRLQEEYSRIKRKTAKSVSPKVVASVANQSLQQSYSSANPPVVYQERVPPQVDLLGEELRDVEWDMLGTNLGFSQSEIREIERDYHTTYRRRMEMFDKWLKKEVNPSWMKIIVALKKMSELNLAAQLTKKYLSASPECVDEGSSVHSHQQQQKKQPSPTTTTGKPLNVNNAFKVVIKCSEKWKKLGVLLDVEISELKKIENAKKDDGDSMIDMLDIWLKDDSSSSQTWNQLADALEKIDEPKLAQAARQNQ